MKYAYIVNGVVHEVMDTPAFTNLSIALKSECVQCDDSVVPGMVYANTVFTAPAPTPTPPPLLPQLTPMQFYLAFTPQERVLIKGASDPIVREFWATYELAAQQGQSIDPNLKSVSIGLQYVVDAGLVHADRVSDILKGVPQ
jgi:hypothetical protein